MISDVPVSRAAFLQGSSVFLRSLETTDGDTLWAWFADRDVVRYSLSLWQFPYSHHETQTWLERAIHDKPTLTLGIVEDTNQALIGFAGIAGISLINRSGEYFILIGDKAMWSRGYGTEVTRLLVDYSFRSLNLHRIARTVSGLNTGGIMAYQRAGFTQEGVLRDACYRDGAYHHKVMMAILRPEWEARQTTATKSMQ